MNDRVMKEYLVLEDAYAYGISLHHARRFTEEEKADCAEWYKDRGFVGLSQYGTIDLKNLNWKDVRAVLGDKEEDGSFRGCNNRSYIITKGEWDALVQLDRQLFEEKEKKQLAEEVALYQKILAACERQGKLYTRSEALQKRKAYNDHYNEGGDGFVPHFYTIEEYEHAKSRLEALNVQ